MKAILKFDMDDPREARMHDFAARQDAWKELLRHVWMDVLQPESPEIMDFVDTAEELCLDLNDVMD